MKIRNGFEVRDVCGLHVLLATGRETIDFSKVVKLNESAYVMWQAVADKEFELEDMVQALLAEYEVTDETAREDATRILNEWKELGLLV